MLRRGRSDAAGMTRKTVNYLKKLSHDPFRAIAAVVHEVVEHAADDFTPVKPMGAEPEDARDQPSVQPTSQPMKPDVEMCVESIG